MFGISFADFRSRGMQTWRVFMGAITERRKRCDSAGRAFAGSQRQLQFYVNESAALLEREISQALQMNVSLRWVSPMRSDLYREYRDKAFLKALGLLNHSKELSRFWPDRGPVWDALAVENLTRGVILVEAKSHVPEIRGGGCKATANSSIQKIDSSIAKTKAWLGVSQGANWKGGVYQSANRISHLHFFRDVLDIPAWLVNIYFVGDPDSPTTRVQWDLGVREAKKELGVSVVPFSTDIFLPAIHGWE
jgi:hypothetical protein